MVVQFFLTNCSSRSVILTRPHHYSYCRVVVLLPPVLVTTTIGMNPEEHYHSVFLASLLLYTIMGGHYSVEWRTIVIFFGKPMLQYSTSKWYVVLVLVLLNIRYVRTAGASLNHQFLL